MILHTLATTEGEEIGTVSDAAALRHLESADPYLWPIRQHAFLVEPESSHYESQSPVLVTLGPGTWAPDPNLTPWLDAEPTLTPDTGQGYTPGYDD